jgi:hypothetical protein
MKKYLLSIVLAFLTTQGFSQRVVVKSDPTLNDRFSKKAGSLRFSSTVVKIGRIMNNGEKSDTVRIYNASTRALSLEAAKVPDHMRVTLGTPTLEAGAESWIAVSYSGAKKNDYGFALDRFELITSDTVQPNKVISVTATIAEYFVPLTSADSAVVQKANWMETTFDYGKIKQGEKVRHSFTFTNEGKRDLHIHKTKSGCECLKTTAKTDTIAAGAAGVVTLEFNSSNKQGPDSRKMYVYLDDPARPEVVLELKGEIGK